MPAPSEAAPNGASTTDLDGNDVTLARPTPSPLPPSARREPKPHPTPSPPAENDPIGEIANPRNP